MARINFNAVFVEKEDGSIAPRQRIRVGGVEMSPEIHIKQNLILGGVDFTQFKGHDLEIQTDGDVLVITGIY